MVQIRRVKRAAAYFERGGRMLGAKYAVKQAAASLTRLFCVATCFCEKLVGGTSGRPFHPPVLCQTRGRLFCAKLAGETGDRLLQQAASCFNK